MKKIQYLKVCSVGEFVSGKSYFRLTPTSEVYGSGEMLVAEVEIDFNSSIDVNGLLQVKINNIKVIQGY